MAEKELVLEFDCRTGEVSIEARGFHGTSCADASKFLRDSLGESKDFQRKSEWFDMSLQEFGYINTKLCG